MQLSPLAGKLAASSMLVNVPSSWPRTMRSSPILRSPCKRVAFGTLGHRGSAFDVAFNEAHILATPQAICLYRVARQINGPLCVSMDTHALSEPALSFHAPEHLRRIQEEAQALISGVFAQESDGGAQDAWLCDEHVVPKLGARAAYGKQAIRDKLLEHMQDITEHGEDLLEVRH